ncbi:MAG: Nif3-like dinuclear metal center hexameric protein [Deltaproteobacteria bacterium]|nr:Nif3-like dinuclear metal center hexameric protein [Deltaproteobacteria bacterium]
MEIKQIEKYINTLFDTTENKFFFEQSGITVKGNRDINRIGYCMNLTMETVEKAKKSNVDLMITHHDAWDFLYELQDECRKKLKEYGISHYYNHLPLDDCKFGTNDSLLKKLGLRMTERTHEYEGFYCGRVAEFDTEISFNTLVQKMEGLLGEPVQAWKFNERKVKRVCIVCGGGADTPSLKEADEKECDVYITGEKVLYTIQYAQFRKLNLIIGSHTFTELFGIESLAMKIKDKYGNLEIIRLEEAHLEAKEQFVK